MKLVALIILLHSIKCYYSHVENATIWVSRRYSLDFYNREPGKSSIRCDVNRPTYMVEQRQCVKNEDLFDGKVWHNVFYVHANNSQSLDIYMQSAALH